MMCFCRVLFPTYRGSYCSCVFFSGIFPLHRLSFMCFLSPQFTQLRSGVMSHVSFAADPCDGRCIQEADMSSLLHSAAMGGPISSLTLEGNRIAPAALRLLSAFVVEHKALQAINLSMCGLGDDGCLAVVRACCQQKSRPMKLRFLNLALNGLTDRGCFLIGRYLQFSCPPTLGVALRSLVISMNPVTAAGVLSLVRGDLLTSLDVKYCLLSFPSDTPVLVQALREDKRLTCLSIEGNQCPKAAHTLLVDAVSSNPKSKLSEASLHWGRAVGDLPTVSEYLATLHTGLSPQLSPPRRHYLDELKMPRTVYESYFQVYGSSIVARREQRQERQSSPPNRSRSPYVTLSQSPYHRLTSVQRRRAHHADPSMDSNVSRAASANGPVRSGACTPVPLIGANHNRDLEQQCAESLERDRSEAQLSEMLAAASYVAPPPETLARRCSRSLSAVRDDATRGRSPSAVSQPSRGVFCNAVPWLSARSSSVTSCSAAAQPDVTTSPTRRRHDESQLWMLLDRCVVSDAQCGLIFNHPHTALLLKPYAADASCGFAAMPAAVASCDASVSVLNGMPLLSPERIRGIAKLFCALAHAGGHKLSVAVAATFTDLPPHVAASAAPAVAHYRSQRAMENKAAKRLVAQWYTSQQKQQPTPAEIRSRAVPRIHTGRRHL